MSLSKSSLAFDDVREIFDKALAAERGIRLKFDSWSKAMGIRHRFNAFRRADRRENSQIYDENHPMFRRSPYDRLELRVPRKGAEDDNYLYIEKRSADAYHIEELPTEPGPERPPLPELDMEKRDQMITAVTELSLKDIEDITKT